MASLFEDDATPLPGTPLAERMRPRSLDEVVGQAHLLAPGDIPVVQVDRCGQVTYHGPGQLVVYPLVDLRRAALGIREFVSALERAVIELAGEYGIAAASRREAPGVYVAARKLASVGVRVRRGGSYHGLALNVALDLGPFARINPCGYAGMRVTQMRELARGVRMEAVEQQMQKHLRKVL